MQIDDRWLTTLTLPITIVDKPVSISSPFASGSAESLGMTLIRKVEPVKHREQLWCFTNTGYVFVLDLKSGLVLKKIQIHSGTPIPEIHVCTLYTSAGEAEMWIGCGLVNSTLTVIDAGGDIKKLIEERLSNSVILGMVMVKGQIWISIYNRSSSPATLEVLIWDLKTKMEIQRKGFKGSNVTGMLCTSKDQQVWVAVDDKIISFDPDTLSEKMVFQSVAKAKISFYDRGPGEDMAVKQRTSLCVCFGQ